MTSRLQINKQTVLGLLMFLVFLWTLSTFTPTTQKALTHITPEQPTHQQPNNRPPQTYEQPGQQTDSSSKPGDKSTAPSDSYRPDKPASSSKEYSSPSTKESSSPSSKESSASQESAPSAKGSSPSSKGSSSPSSKESSSPSPKESSPSASSSSKTKPKPASSDAKDRPLILYAYAESAAARENIKFFINQGLHDAADFVFILNGETDAANIIPKKTNIRVVQRSNTCFDLGAYGEILRKDDLYKKHKRFVMLNASVRGPFLPHYAQSCWSDLYLDRITDKVKLVGMTGNCWPRFHVQSMIWATDSVGIDLLLNAPASASVQDQFGSAGDPVGLAGCYNDWNAAVHAEVGATSAVREGGYQVDLMMAAFHKSENYIDECDTSQNGDVLWNGKYFGTNVHPYETIFIKANRDIDPTLIEHLTTWQQASGFDSYKACGAKP